MTALYVRTADGGTLPADALEDRLRELARELDALEHESMARLDDGSARAWCVVDAARAALAAARACGVELGPCPAGRLERR